jgi:uncharacterized membrane protein YccC
MGLFLVPVGFAVAWSRSPALTVVFGGVAVAVMRVLAAANPMVYDTAQFSNTALAIFVGSVIGMLVFRLLPPLSPVLRAGRLLSLTLNDLRRLALGNPPTRPADWECRMYDRLTALSDQAEPLQRAQLLAAASVGIDINCLRHLVSHLGAARELGVALASFARGNSTTAIARLHELDHRLASDPDTGPGTDSALRARGRISAIIDALAEHGAFFDMRASA